MSRFCPEGMIFDMDGLLVNTEPVWMSIEQQMLEARGFVYDPDITAKYIGVGLMEFWQGVIRDYGLRESPGALLEQAVAQMVTEVPRRVKEMPGASALLAYCHELGMPCAIATGSYAPVVDAVVSAHGWDAYFSVHVARDHVQRGKPAPDTYLLAAEKLGIAPSACLALEDSPNGARAAVAAGMTVFAVPDSSHTDPSRFADITPHVFDSLHDVLTHLKEC